MKLEAEHDLEYLLIVGDWDKVPTRLTRNSYFQSAMGEPSTFASDLYFACVDQGATWNLDGDSYYGEDGDLDGKVRRIEEVDAALPKLLDAEPDAVLVTGDHSTPPGLKAHSWHPVPVLMKAPWLRGGDAAQFDEVSCRCGQIGTIPAKALIPLAMAHCGKLEKFGA